MKVSVAIPNFNGDKLLVKNLPNILESGVDEVIVLDDGSTDGSLEMLQKFQISNNKLQTNSKFQIIIHKKNKGFISSVNELFDNASGDIVISLNNDVFVEKDFIKPLVKHFENSNVFAVNLHEEGEGPSVAFWKNGFFEFKRGEESGNVHKSAWASGGSAAYSRKIWQELGGFDPLFAPFYWEDIDISFRVLKKGYEILWEPMSKIKHEHETTIKKFNQRYVRWVRERNQLLFIWKNITDPKLKAEHRRGLLRRLFSGGVGYWIPYLWALISISLRKKAKESLENARTDLETINYANA